MIDYITMNMRVANSESSIELKGFARERELLRLSSDSQFYTSKQKIKIGKKEYVIEQKVLIKESNGD